MDHLPLVALDDLAGLGQVDHVAQLGLAGERSVAKALTGGERVADRDEEPRQRPENAGEAHDPRCREQRDTVGMLAAQRAWCDTDHDVADDDHRRRSGEHGVPALAEPADGPDRDHDGGCHLGSDAKQQHHVEVARRFGNDPAEGLGAATVVPEVVIDVHARDAGQRRVRCGT